MRESVGNTWVFMLVILFTLIFSGFLVLVLTYSKAYKIKNEITSMVEKYEGLTDNSTSIINNYMNNSGYAASGYCNDGDYGLKSDGTFQLADKKTKYGACFTINTSFNNCNVDVSVFYHFNLPILGKISSFKITGQTNTLNYLFVKDGYNVNNLCL